MEYMEKCLNNQNHDHDETRTRNLLIRSQTPYPLGHAATCLYKAVAPVQLNLYNSVIIFKILNIMETHK
jgi:hypothetical protein